ncbi:hypothetical protein HPB51_000345 [Rhipicephalus microplus]|uniref:C2H2-type domain-containing protein n=1 Tax=Rhipicephalus microplus TaxID=6941 RepID=A0A9J6E4E4_RHIMP|nr:hypothetical protein HPB51_000345 [Rhipicephalus microplus]
MRTGVIWQRRKTNPAVRNADVEAVKAKRQRRASTSSTPVHNASLDNFNAQASTVPTPTSSAKSSTGASCTAATYPVPAELVRAKRKVVQRCPRGDRALLVETATILGKEGSSPSAEAGSTINVYRCSYCFKEFRKIQDLTSHVGRCLWLQPRKCPLCSNMCSNWISMQDHIAMHVEELGTKCPLCECAVVVGNKDVLRHVMQHLTFKPFLCGVCKYTFLHGYDIAAHVCKLPSQRGRWAFPRRTTP